MTLEQLAENEELTTGLIKAANTDELMELLKENNIVLEDGLTPEEAFQTVQQAIDAQRNGTELGDADLENVSGGALAAIPLATACGAVGAFVVGGFVLGALVSYGYHKGKKRGWW